MTDATLADLAQDLAAGRTTSRALTEQALAAAEDAAGEGARTFTAVFRDGALAEAEASDRLRGAGIVPSPLAGIPVSVKDLLDVAGQTTRAGSVVRGTAEPAAADAPVVARLRAAGAVIVGRTNMTEFAYSGIGINPHYGTPRNPYDRETGRIPGGSSSGAAVSVTDGMAAAAVGTDTGGSVRIPSALCGLTGFKPTARRVPTDGAFPLSWSLDSIGPLARSVACCVTMDQVMSGAPIRAIAPVPVAGLRFAVARTLVLDDLEPAVATAFERACARLSAAGARIEEIDVPAFAGVAALGRRVSIVAAEAFHICRDLLAADEARFDPRVSVRMKSGERISASDYIGALEERARLQSEAARITSLYDAVLMPTTARTAPPIDELEASDEAYHAANLAMLRNCTVGNMLDRCAATLPIHEPGTAPVGLMVMGETMADARTLAIAGGVEALLG